MIKQFFAAATIVTALASIQTEASFVHTDWKTEGDKKAVLHTETGLEWLKLSETFNMTYVDEGGVTRTVQRPEHYNFALSTTLLGWRFPTEDEVRTMLSSFFDIALPWQQYSAHYATYAQSFTTLFGTGTYTTNYTMGMWYTDSGQLRRSGTYVNGGYSLFYGAENSAYPGGWIAAFLVSDGGTTLSSINDPTININNPNAPINQGGPAADVASPAGLAAAGALLMLLGARRRKLRG